MPLTLHLPQDLEDQLEERRRRDGFDPETYVLSMLRENLASAEPPSEQAYLLAEIASLQNPLSPAELRRYRRLQKKREEGTLTPDEQAVLIAFSDRWEQADAIRLERLLRLSQLWQLPLRETMVRVGAKTAGVAR